MAELAGHRAVLLSTDSQRYWPLSGDSLPCQRVLSCNNITFAREAVVAGAGIAALPALICAESVHSGRLVRLLADVPLPVGELYAVYPSRRFQAMKVKAFLDFLISRLPADTGRLLEPEAARLITSRP
ncbi:LysR family transcriptional regulator [Pseudomonas aeruginosa]|nr:LysR family transcriptional regulator [Pseudomonas aeruginosa]CRS10717.1 LysR family transcriptional regulator [Pseudomonas aeruginosa]